MQKKTGAIMLVAGTCIGSGMIALPMILAKIGIIPSIFLMLTMCSIIYYTSLVNLEINLQAGKGITLGELGRKFSGKIAEFIGVSSFKALSYALLSVYIYGGVSIFQKLLASGSGHEYSSYHIANIYALSSVALLLLPIKLLDYVNRFLFTGLLAVVAVLLAGLISNIHWNNFPLFNDQYSNISIWRTILPVAFTAFGFQVIFHTLTNFCNKDAKMLKSVFLWGSIIPAIVYIIWTCSILIVVHQENPIFYQEMIDGKVEVGDLIQELSSIAKWPFVQLLIWWISILAIVTSLLGVGMGLCDSIKNMLPEKITNLYLRNLLGAIITILPAYILAILIPNAFIIILGFAGMILVVIAVLLPIYLLYKAKITKFNYKELQYKWLVISSAIAGVIIMLCELLNILSR